MPTTNVFVFHINIFSSVVLPGQMSKNSKPILCNTSDHGFLNCWPHWSLRIHERSSRGQCTSLCYLQYWKYVSFFSLISSGQRMQWGEKGSGHFINDFRYSWAGKVWGLLHYRFAVMFIFTYFVFCCARNLMLGAEWLPAFSALCTCSLETLRLS